MRQLLTERYRERLAGVLSCYDRIIVTGTLPGACYAKGMMGFLSARQIRVFDYPRFAEPLRDRVRERATELANTSGVIIEHIAKNHLRKEDIVAKVLAARGDHPGLVHIISAMEACNSYKPWHDKQTHRTFLRPDTGKCLHYYFYFIDAELGLIYLRVPTWCPFRLQFYCNGHSWLARQLIAAGIGFTLADPDLRRGRRCLPAHRRLGARADPCQWPLARRAASRPRSLRPAVLSGARRVRSVLSLEFHAGRVRH